MTSHLLGRLLIGTSLAFGAIGPIAAQQSPPAPAPVVTPAPAPALPAFVKPPAKPAKSVSAFILCDGRTGHVSAGETLGRLLLLSATAGLSETATAADDASRRLKGMEGVAACDTALAQEDNPLRRSELAQAKAIHLIEAGAFEQALVAARAVPGIAGPLVQDAGFARSGLPRVLLLEAYILLRLNRLDEADHVAVRAVQMAPYDVAFLRRAAPFFELSPTIYPDKRAVLEHSIRVAPERFPTFGEVLVAAGLYRDADAIFEARDTMGAGFYKDHNPEGLQAFRSVLLMLAGDRDRSNTMAAQVRARIPILAASGINSTNNTFLANVSEVLVLQSILNDLEAGHASEARATFRAHGPFLLTMATLVETVVARLRADAPAAELTGSLSDDAAGMRKARLVGTLAGWAKPEVSDRLYADAQMSSNAAAYTKAGEAVWKPAKKARMLQTPNDAQFEIVNTLPWVNGLPASDAAYLYAATLAKARGVNGFAVLPFRRYAWEIGVRFGNVGDPGFPAATTLSADAVIADIAPYMPQPAPAR